MVLEISPNMRRHFTMQKRTSIKDVRDLHPGPKLALRATADPAAAAASSSSSSSSSSIAIATTSTHAPSHSAASPFVASSSSANRVVSTTPTTSSVATSTVTPTTQPAAAAATSDSTSDSTSSSASSSRSQVFSASSVSSPGTTFIAGPFITPTTVTTYIPPTIITTTSSESSASPSTTTTSKSLLANTGAAAAVFTTVGLIGLAVLIMAVSFLIKRHRRAQSQDDDEYFEKIVTPHSYDNSGVAGSRGLASLDPIHLSDANNMYNTHGDGNYSYTGQDYGLEYPPGTSYTPQEHANTYNTPGTRATLNSLDDPFGSRMPAPVHLSNPHGHPYGSSESYY